MESPVIVLSDSSDIDDVPDNTGSHRKVHVQGPSSLAVQEALTTSQTASQQARFRTHHRLSQQQKDSIFKFFGDGEDDDPRFPQPSVMEYSAVSELRQGILRGAPMPLRKSRKVSANQESRSNPQDDAFSDSASYGARDSNDERNSSRSGSPSPPSGDSRSLRIRIQEHNYREPALISSSPMPSHVNITTPYPDILRKALYVEGRLPFLPRNLRHATEHRLRLLKARGLFEADPRVGISVTQAEEIGLDKWVCSICPENLMGVFGSQQGRNVHMRLCHKEYMQRFTQNQTKHAAKKTVPAHALSFRAQTGIQSMNSPRTAVTWRQASSTELGPVPNLGYMTEHLQLQEMRALAYPTAHGILQSAWRRFIWLHRQDFVSNPPRAVRQFMHDYSAALHTAGSAALYAFLLWLVANKFISDQDLLALHADWKRRA
ncbi:hypothetical protein BKA62DRAFT_140308 [Auriculariales sp. MPI-PUGE-AT-0066]|nr:hypothetical protein BKA62DRAFT_140308 [Auriculariales sp. MPI-PUGE-AT-0066]